MPRDGSLVPEDDEGDAAMPWDDSAPMPEPRVARHVAPVPAGPTASTPASILERWGIDGPLVHEPTGLEILDDATRGGPVYGAPWYIVGAPDAGKTALLVQIAHVYAQRGVMVGLLAVDEDPSGVLTRIAQRAGHTREECETRSPTSLARMRSTIGGLPIRLYDADWTIDAAAADLAAAAKPGRAMLGIDSIQTARCDAEILAARDVGLAMAVELRARAVRAAASTHSLVALVTSEMGRAGYRSSASSENVDALASAKWSSAIEYSAQVMISLRSIRGEDETIRAEIAKNKHGRARLHDVDPAHDRALYLRIDRARQTLEECDRPEAAERDEDARDDAQRATAEERIRRDAARVAQALAAAPDITARDLRASVPGLGSGRVDQAAALLVRLAAIVRVDGPRGRVGHYLDGRQVPDDVLRHLPAEHRAKVSWARPPGEGGEA